MLCIPSGARLAACSWGLQCTRDFDGDYNVQGTTLGTTMYRELQWGRMYTGDYTGDSSVDHNRDYNVPPLEGVLGVAGGVGRPRLRVRPAAAPARLVAGDPGSSSPSTPPLTEAPSSPSSESVGKPPEIMTTQGNQSSQFWPKAVLTMGDV